jgi:hypothetical protein
MFAVEGIVRPEIVDPMDCPELLDVLQEDMVSPADPVLAREGVSGKEVGCLGYANLYSTGRRRGST